MMMMTAGCWLRGSGGMVRRGSEAAAAMGAAGVRARTRTRLSRAHRFGRPSRTGLGTCESAGAREQGVSCGVGARAHGEKPTRCAPPPPAARAQRAPGALREAARVDELVVRAGADEEQHDGQEGLEVKERRHGCGCCSRAPTLGALLLLWQQQRCASRRAPSAPPAARALPHAIRGPLRLSCRLA